MFKKIESIANAATWSNYDGRTSAAPEFQRYNLIYGWNASGKTTLSRVIGLFAESIVSRLPSGARIRARVGQEVLDSAKDRGRITVRVFNRDFIDDNLQRDDHTQAPALFIIGQENIRLSNRVASLTQRRGKVAAMYKGLQAKQAEVTGRREKAATDLARECGQILGVRRFLAPDLKALAQRLQLPAENLLDEAALQASVTQARDQSEIVAFRNWPELTPSQLLTAEDISLLLKETPQQSAIKRLADDPVLSEWVRGGLRFHEHTATCAFCGGDATHALAAYARHFSDEYRRQHAAIHSAIGRLEKLRTFPTFPHLNDWVPSVREKAHGTLQQLERWVARENEVRAAWVQRLREKLANMDTAFAMEPVEDRSVEFERILLDVKRAKNEHDRACGELAATRSQAAERVKTHFAARYLLDPAVAEAKEMLGQVEQVLGRVQEVGQKIKAAMEGTQSELQRSSVAASQINSIVMRLLGPRISVEQTLDNRIQFTREGQPATNMSDGERTAISLAYFLVSLSQHGHRLEDQVVFVDDPICSLDANHIYDVAYLIIRTLRDCRQLFISTHNSEFFNTIKQDWAGQRKFSPGHAGFLIHREGSGPSQLLELPSHLVKFRSDYHHVFHCLRRFEASTSPDIDDYLGCPNLLRRFLEMYLGFKRPTAKSYVAKLDILFDDEIERSAVARYADEGSHSTSTLRLLEYSDFPALSREMVGRVMRAVERVDPDHFAILISETA